MYGISGYAGRSDEGVNLVIDTTVNRQFEWSSKPVGLDYSGSVLEPLFFEQFWRSSFLTFLNFLTHVLYVLQIVSHWKIQMCEPERGSIIYQEPISFRYQKMHLFWENIQT